MRTEGYFRVRSQFSRDHFASPTPGTVVVGQRHDDHEPVELEIANLDKVVMSTTCYNTPRNRLIEDFIGAIRNDDKNHESIDDFFAAQTVCEGGGLG